MNSNLNGNDYKVMWVIGAAERLATLGFIGGNIPLRIAPDFIDQFIEIDEHRNHLFESDFEVVQIFKIMARSESAEEIDDEDMNSMVELILEYKNNREEMVKYALSHVMV